MGNKKAFLKWPGGKSKSIDFLKAVIGKVDGRFIEPFLGSGVVSFNIEATKYLLNDSNKDLINLYKVILDYQDLFVKIARIYFSNCNNEKDYYDLREYFNSELPSSFDKAVIFLYLNRHSFNVITRYNNAGFFNVPFGNYKSTYFPEKEILGFISYMWGRDVSFFSLDALKLLSIAVKEDDVVYCDPPYASNNKTAFTKYATKDFTLEHQRKLADIAELRKAKLFLVSNNDNELTRDLYKNADEILTTDVPRSIAAKSTSRKKASELLAIYRR